MTPEPHGRTGPGAITIQDWRRVAVGSLVGAGQTVESAQADVAVIARHVLDWDTATWLTRQGAEIDAATEARLDAAMTRRRTDEPVAYIVGEREFYGRPFTVTSAVLIPRPETELLVAAALERLDRIDPGHRATPDVLDVGTGSGCIAVTLACERPAIRVTATDSSPDALDVARVNVTRQAVGDRVTLEWAHLVGAPGRRFDLIVSNPPYVPERDRESLASDVRDFEPAAALFGGPDGLSVIGELAPAAYRALEPGGWFLMEFGIDQRDAVTTLLDRTGFVDLDVRADLAGHPRVVIARRPDGSV